ncbi:Carboxy-terminal processing protease CtpA precursor [compost metagenome]
MLSVKRYWKTYFLGLALLIVLFVMAGTGFQVKAFAQERYAELQNFSKVLNLIQQYYVEEADTKKLVYGAIKGMLRELDPHTNFMPPELFKDFESETSGEFGGLGIEISIQNGILTIISPIEDAPAWEAGIKAGDKVIAVNGTSTKGVSLVEASQLMRGKRGTKVVLRVVRDGEDKPRDIPVVRGSVKIKSVKYTNLGEGYGYVKVTSFIENTSKDLEKIVEAHAKSNNGKVSGLLIDMRRNPGGLLDQAIKVSDMFLKEGTIVSTIGRNKSDKEVAVASKKGKFTDFPVVILVNEYTASASEIVSGALQDNKRALIVGQRTFGKGSVQSVIKLGDGSGLKLTVARYYTPSGVSIQAEGIHPDIEIEDVDADAYSKAILKSSAAREGDIAGHLKGDKEKAAEKLDMKKNTEDGALAWWKDLGSQKDDNKLSPKDKLFKSDYQAYQAFSYLKTWTTLKTLNR